MRSSIVKIIFAVIITALLAGGGVYYWQQSAQPVVTPAVTASAPELFELAKASDNEFTYLVTAPKLDGDWKMTINNNFENYVLRFSLKYKFFPWGALRYRQSDLTATDGQPPVNGLSGFAAYHFCAANYYCDDTTNKGMGFSLTFWNANFIGRQKDPNFYLEGGNTFVKETGKYIVTYKPFTDSRSQQEHIDTEVSKIMSSFELY